MCLYDHYSNKDEVSKDKLSEANLIVFGGSRETFTPVEFDEIKAYLKAGGRVIVHLSDGGDKQSGSNINNLLQEFGITGNSDSVLRSVYHKYLHPKEVYIAEGVLVPDISKKKNTVSLGGGAKKAAINSSNRQANMTDRLVFVYPYGNSLNIARPSRPLLSSGPVSYPINRPVAGVWESETNGSLFNQKGKLVVFGSAELFGDDWLDKEENSKLCDIIYSWMLNETDLDVTSDRQDSVLSEPAPVPNIEALAQSLKPCLQGMDDIPKDFMKMFDYELFRFDTDLIPKTIQLYESLGVPHEQLTLIPPQFECPLPKMSPATFPPSLREPPPPALDQFDLDEHFAKESLRLAQLTNKCTNGDEDLEYYIAEAGEILGVMQNLPFGERSAKHILFYIFMRIVDFKRTDLSKSLEEINGVGVARAYEIGDGDIEASYGPSVEALPVRVAHVDLAPMKKDVGRSQLEKLDSNLNIRGGSIPKITSSNRLDSKE